MFFNCVLQCFCCQIEDMCGMKKWNTLFGQIKSRSNLHFAFHEYHVCLNIKPSSARTSCSYLSSLMKISKNKYVFYNNHCDSKHFSNKKPRETRRNSEKFREIPNEMSEIVNKFVINLRAQFHERSCCLSHTRTCWGTLPSSAPPLLVSRWGCALIHGTCISPIVATPFKCKSVRCFCQMQNKTWPDLQQQQQQQ